MYIVISGASLLKVLKHTGSKFKKQPGEPLRNLPEPLAMAIESLLLDRMALGEEIGLDFVENAVREFVNIWNEKIDEFRSQALEISGPMVLAQEGQHIHDDMEEEELGRVQGRMVQSMQSIVKALSPIDISFNNKALAHLDVIIFDESACKL